ncbi:hypothetical protein HA48_01365 [Pantoea wallisii]|uniref:DUF1496 domain-containing protein n=1 Tax=Pantoea wallisii TaxID=1076551 RepID=A0A1X1DEJ4_9GAMM|nr:YnjH family protein [Pantoea wallisii]ORM75133.1 hypothetical protein HA48_01365 [Pantoea wallisii]
MRYAVLWLSGVLLCSASALANRQPESGHMGTNTDVVVDMPSEVWTQGQNRQRDCLQCCIYENRNYSEGAVVKAEGVLLQCARDEKVLGTNPLIWKIIK